MGPIGVARSAVANTYVGSLRVIVTVAAWALFGIFLVVCASLWNRSVATSDHELGHAAEMLEQGVKSHFSSIDLFLRTLGNELVYRDMLADREQAARFLQRIKPHQEGVVGLAFISAEGDVWVTNFADNALPLPSLSAIEAVAADFQQVRENPHFYVAKPYFFEPIEKWVVQMSTPIFAENNALIGFMSLVFELEGGLHLAINVTVQEGIQVSLQHPDYYPAYVYPLTRQHTEETLVKLYHTKISPELRELMRKPEGVYQYQRKIDRIARIEQAYAYIKPMPEYNLTAVAMRGRAKVLHTWFRSLLIPFAVLLSAYVALWLAARRAQCYLQEAEREIYARQSALVQSLERYGKLTALIPAGVYQLRVKDDGSREFYYLSPRARAMFGIPEAMPLSETLDYAVDLIHQDDIESFVETEESAIQRGVPFSWQGRFNVNNDVLWVNIYSQPGEGDVAGNLWHGVMLDITEQRRSGFKS